MAPWRMIIRVREDHGTIYVRIPRAWAKEKKVGRGSYVVMKEVVDGALLVSTFDDEVKNGKGIDDGESGGDK